LRQAYRKETSGKDDSRSKLLAEGGLGETDLMPRSPQEEPPNKPLKRTKPAQIVLENRGSQRVPAFVYHRPPDGGFAA
jgi:hypothetical protein